MGNTTGDLPRKDETRAHPIPTAWRPTLIELVDALVRGHLGLNESVVGVEPVSPETHDQITRYLESYGETLTALPEETWETSIAQWMDGWWDCLVDLWTRESGPSDLVLFLRVTEIENGGYRFTVTSLHVP